MLDLIANNFRYNSQCCLPNLHSNMLPTGSCHRPLSKVISIVQKRTNTQMREKGNVSRMLQGDDVMKRANATRSGNGACLFFLLMLRAKALSRIVEYLPQLYLICMAIAAFS